MREPRPISRLPGHGNHDPDSDDHDSDDAAAAPGRRPRGIMLLPNLITTGALFAGFYAMVAAANGSFVNAAIAVFVAMALDAADGRVARLTRTESPFGAQYDSLSDMVAFGVAPGLLAFFWTVQSLGRLGWVATFIYMACAALRLARYNTTLDNSSFTGLASPSAAAIVAATIWVWHDFDYGAPTQLVSYGMAALMAALGLLMVSPFRYYSPKSMKLRERVPFVTLVLAVIIFALFTVQSSSALLTLFVLYALSGPAAHVWNALRKGSSGSDLSE